MVGRGLGPFLLILLDAVEKHRAAIEYDWRAVFGVPFSDVEKGRMSLGEACRLLSVLAGDPSSKTAAAMEGWPYTFSREAMVLADLYDLTHSIAAQGKRVRPYPRPWPDVDTSRLGKTSLPQDKVRALLARRAPARADTPKE